MTSQASSSQSARFPAVPNGSPSIVCSFSAQPAPRPNSQKRLRTGGPRSTAALASTAGWRYVLQVTMQPILVLDVATAIPASSAQGFQYRPVRHGGAESGQVDPMHQQWSNPASSATRSTPSGARRSWRFWLTLSPIAPISAMVHSSPAA